MEHESYLKAARVEGEVILLHCWACGTAHYMNLELCAPEQLPHLICGNDHCKMSLFMVSEIESENDAPKHWTTSELITRLAAYSRLLR